VVRNVIHTLISLAWKVFIQYCYFSKFGFDEQLIHSSFDRAVIATIAKTR
jgi:hypothetical protein